jgi:hypothetical protein
LDLPEPRFVAIQPDFGTALGVTTLRGDQLDDLEWRVVLGHDASGQPQIVRSGPHEDPPAGQGLQ